MIRSRLLKEVPFQVLEVLLHALELNPATRFSAEQLKVSIASVELQDFFEEPTMDGSQ